MTQTSYPFEGIDTTETQFSKWAKHFNNGVNDEPSGTALEVSVGTGLAVDVEAGEAMVRGHYYISDATESLALATADATNDRLDLVVLKLDPTANSITLAVKTGTPAGSPAAPTPVQTEAGIFEQPLAEVLVPATSGVPTTITDRREFMGTRLGSWTTAGRPTPAGRVLFGFNTDTETIEFYNTEASGWQDVTPVTGRNLLYNGAMQVAQRGTSAAGLTNGSNGYHTADRWKFAEGGAPTFVFTQSVESDGPTGSGFTKSLKMLATTGQGSLGASDSLRIVQNFEGQNLQGIKKGTSSAESLTLSFWVKSNVTGTYVAELSDIDNTRSISASYTVSSSGTWEKKTITFAGDTTGALDNDNLLSLELNFWLAVGTDFTSGTLATSWGARTNANRAVGQVNLAASTSNYWQITGVQLEMGTVANGFEHKPFGQELAECQRYYEKSYDLETTPGTGTFTGVVMSSGDSSSASATYIGTGFRFSKAKRAAPTVVFYDTAGTSGACTRFNFGGASNAGQTVAGFNIGTMGGLCESSSGSTRQAIAFHYTADAEL